MKKNLGYSTLELLTALALVAGSYALTIEQAEQVETELDKYLDIRTEQQKQICKIRPSLCLPK